MGGVEFQTTRSTLLSGGGFFSALCEHLASDQEVVFLDRDPTHFRHVLNWLRGCTFLPADAEVLEELAWEADFYCMADMRERCATAMREAKRVGTLNEHLSNICSKMV